MSGGLHGGEPCALDTDLLVLALRRALGLDRLPDVAAAQAHGWPPGPGGMPPGEVAGLVESLLTDARIVGVSPPGVTRARLAALLAPARRTSAAALLDWLDAAGLLDEPRSEALRRREPRRLRSSDPGWIAERLRATPPDPGAAAGSEPC
jgi:hypothetical protein